MVQLTKKQFENRLLFLQKLYYGGYITEAEKEALGRPVKDDNAIWCNCKTTVEGRNVEVATNYRKLITVDNDFMVFEDDNGNIKCVIRSEVKQNDES